MDIPHCSGNDCGQIFKLIRVMLKDKFTNPPKAEAKPGKRSVVSIKIREKVLTVLHAM